MVANVTDLPEVVVPLTPCKTTLSAIAVLGLATGVPAAQAAGTSGLTSP